MKNFFVLLLVFLFSFTAFAQNADIRLLRDINLHRDKSLDPAFKFITNSASPVGFALPAGMLAVSLFNHDSTLRSNAIYIGASMIISTVITSSLKIIVKRQRPFITYPEIQKESDGGSYSFPSGHTTIAFSTATSISMAYPKWYVIAPAFLWASAVGYSRADLGVHYPSDILAGALIGSGTAYLCYKLNEKIHACRSKRKREHLLLH